MQPNPEYSQYPQQPSGAFPPNPGQYPPQYGQNPGQYPPHVPGQYTQYPQPPSSYPPHYPSPQPPVQQEPPKKKKNKLVIGCGALIALVVLIGVISAVSGGSKNSASSTSNSSTGSSQPLAKHFSIGDTVKVGDTWQAVVNNVKTDDGGQYSGLKSGDTYLVVDISLTNLSNQEQVISSALNFTLQDSTGQKYNEGIDTNTGATPDGKVAAGLPLRGSIAFEVPVTQKNFTFAFDPNIISSGQTIWDLTIS